MPEMPQTPKFKASEIYNTFFMSILVPLFETVSLITVIFTILLIFIIIKATPPTMKSFKFYLLQYAVFTLLLEFVLLITTPVMLHPYFYFYPAGIAKSFHPNISFAILVIGLFAGIGLLDCCIAMTLKRYFAISIVHADRSRIPFCIYCFLTATNILALIFFLAVAFIKPLSDTARVPSENIASFIAIDIEGLEKLIPLQSIIIIGASKLNSIPLSLIALISFILIRLVLALGALLLNVKSSKNLKIQFSPALQKRNEILRLVTLIQFSGFFFLLGCPFIIIISVYYFSTTPSTITVTLSLLMMNCFGLYDTSLTTIFIKPYRRFFYLTFFGKSENSTNYVLPVLSDPSFSSSSGNRRIANRKFSMF